MTNATNITKAMFKGISKAEVSFIAEHFGMDASTTKQALLKALTAEQLNEGHQLYAPIKEAKAAENKVARDAEKQAEAEKLAEALAKSEAKKQSGKGKGKGSAKGKKQEKASGEKQEKKQRVMATSQDTVIASVEAVEGICYTLGAKQRVKVALADTTKTICILQGAKDGVRIYASAKLYALTKDTIAWEYHPGWAHENNKLVKCGELEDYLQTILKAMTAETEEAEEE